MTDNGTPITEQSLGELVATATRDFSVLLRKEVELAKTEIQNEAKRVGIGAGLLGGSGFFGLFALVMLSAAGALAISEGADLDFWVGFLCIGALYGGLATMLGLGGILKLVKVKPPERTIRTVKDDIAWVKHPTVAPPEAELEELRATHQY